jgi:hypothetical protein
MAAARAAAEAEIAAAIELSEHPEGTLIALYRTVDRDGTIREQFRTLRPAGAREAAQMPCSAGAFAIVEDDGGAPPAPESDTRSGLEVSLVELAEAQRAKPQ